MTDSELLGYVGAVSGLIGALTGIAGAVLGYVGYRRSDNMKAMDLRLELMKTVADAFHGVEEVHGLLARAKRSRTAIAAATGRRGSGAHEQWMRQLEADFQSVEVLDEEFEELNIDHSKLTHSELERRIVGAHSLRASISQMRDKYKSELAADDKDRDRLHEDRQSRG